MHGSSTIASRLSTGAHVRLSAPVNAVRRFRRGASAARSAGSVRGGAVLAVAVISVVLLASSLGAFLVAGVLAAQAALVMGVRRAARRNAAMGEARFRAVAARASDGIYMVDARTLRFLDANPAFCRLVGYSLEELKASTLHDLWTGAPATPAAVAAEPERTLRRKDGSVVRVAMQADRIPLGGREGLSFVVRDVSRSREREDALLRARQQADEVTRLRSSLLTNVNHEIRTPLCSILGWSSVLKEELGDAHRDVVEQITRSGERLQWTLDAVLELAHLEANTRRLHPVQLDVADEIGYVMQRWAQRAEEKGLEFELTKPASLPGRLDPVCLHRILDHLVDNAIKFTDSGRIAVEVSALESDLCLQVTDTGVGIGEAFRPYVFDEFKQESEGLTRSHEGTGLGLAITRRLVELLGGRVAVESEKGEGTRFTVVLPDVLAVSGRRAEGGARRHEVQPKSRRALGF